MVVVTELEERDNFMGIDWPEKSLRENRLYRIAVIISVFSIRTIRFI